MYSMVISMSSALWQTIWFVYIVLACASDWPSILPLITVY